MAFGSGVLIGAVAFELAEEAYDTPGGRGVVRVGVMTTFGFGLAFAISALQ